MFVDRVELFVQGGKGGDGCLSFRREKFVPRGGPDGGDGGHGGSVVLQASHDANSLADLSFRRHWKADAGRPGQGKQKTGKSGEDLVIAVPPGTVVRNRDDGTLFKDLGPDDRVVIAAGGKGGRGNVHFKHATNQTPRQFEPGTAGEERWLVLELKSIADVGLIGLPNAGKSTLLSRLTKARPEIAGYPFTTKYPNLGICWLDEDRTCVIADIPGLIEGAADGAGLGHEFLRHVERTRVLVHLVECRSADESDPVANYRTIRGELAAYSDKLVERPELIVVSKKELSTEAAEQATESLRGQSDGDVLAVSAVTGDGLDRLRRRIAALLDDAPEVPDSD